VTSWDLPTPPIPATSSLATPLGDDSRCESNRAWMLEDATALHSETPLDLIPFRHDMGGISPFPKMIV
jgi:hypothetical protein